MPYRYLRLSITTFFLLTSNLAFSQQVLKYNWTKLEGGKRGGEPGGNTPDFIISHPNGEYSIYSMFSDSIVMGGIKFRQAGVRNSLFITRFNNQGQRIWSRAYPRLYPQFMMATRDNGYFITGTFDSTLVTDVKTLYSPFAPDPQTDPPIRTFFLKLDSTGHGIWANQSFESMLSAELGRHRYSEDVDGNLYFLGDAAGGITKLDTITIVRSVTLPETYYFKISPLGKFLYARVPPIKPSSIVVDSRKNLLFSYNFTGFVNVNDVLCFSAGQSDVLVVKYDSAGRYIWHRQMGGTQGESFQLVGVDKDDNPYGFLSYGFFSSAGVAQTKVNNILYSNGQARVSSLYISFTANGQYRFVRKGASPINFNSGGDNMDLLNTVLTNRLSYFGDFYPLYQIYGGNTVGNSFELNGRNTSNTEGYPFINYLSYFDRTGTLKDVIRELGEFDHDSRGAVYGLLNAGKVPESNDFLPPTCPEVLIEECIQNKEFIVAKILNCSTVKATMTSATGGDVICANDTARYSVSVTSLGRIQYRWQQNGSDISSANGPTFKTNLPGSYRCIVTNSNGCIDTSNVRQLTLSGQNLSTISNTIIGANPVCRGQSVRLKANVPAGVGVQWRLGADSVAGATDTILSAFTGGWYHFVATNTSGCLQASPPVEVKIQSPFSAVISADGDQLICLGGQKILFANNGPSIGFQWLRNDTAIALATQPLFTSTQAGKFKVITTDGNGCRDTSSSLTLTYVNKPPIPVQLTGNSVLCEGQSTTLLATPQGSFGFRWLKNGSQITGATTNNLTVNASGVYQVQLVGGNQNLYCKNPSDAVVVTMQDPISAIVQPIGLPQLCTGDSLLLAAPVGAGYQYQWLLNNDTLTGENQPGIFTHQPGTYNVRITVGPCSKLSAGIVVTQIPLSAPVATLQGSAILCSGQSATLTATVISGQEYRWRRNGQEFGIFQPVLTITQPGLYALETWNAAGCRSVSASFDVQVLTSPVANILASGPLSFCAGGQVVLFGSGGTGTGFQWLRNDTIIQGATAPLLTASQSGAYRFISKLGTACNDTSDVVVVVVQATPSVSLSPVGNPEICAGDSVLLKAVHSPGSVLKWMQNSDTLSVPADSLWVKQTGNFSAVARNGSCYQVSGFINVLVRQLPVATILVIGGTLVAQPSGLHYQWIKGADSLLTDTVAVFSPTESGTYRVVVTDEFGCRQVSAHVTITSANNILDSWNSSISVFPNPASDILHIQGKTTGHVSYTLTDLSGRPCKKGRSENSNFAIPITDLPAGMYLLSLKTADGTRTMKVWRD